MSYTDHALKHMLKYLGGTDPLRVSLPMAILSNSGKGDQIIDSSAEELLWGTDSEHSTTNAPEVFRFDPDDPAGLLVYEPGYYLCVAVVHNSVGSNAVARSVYQESQPLSSGPGPFGVELGFPYGFTVGSGQGNESLGEADGTTSKSSLSHIALTSMGDRDDPSRYAVVCAKGAGGADWAVSASEGASAVVVKVSDYFFGHIAAPPEA